MVLIVGGAPVSANKACTASPRRHGREAHLPQIPQSGPRSLLDRDVLLSRIEEIYQSEEQQRLQRLLAPASPKQPLRLLSSSKIKQSIVDTLHTKDHVQSPRFLDTLLAATHDSGPRTFRRGESDVDDVSAEQELEADQPGGAGRSVEFEHPLCRYSSQRPTSYGIPIPVPPFDTDGTLGATPSRPSTSGAVFGSSRLAACARPHTESARFHLDSSRPHIETGRLHTASSTRSQNGRLHTASSLRPQTGSSRQHTASSTTSRFASSRSTLHTASTRSMQPGTSGNALRNKHLRESFSRGLREIATRLMDLDQMHYECQEGDVDLLEDESESDARQRAKQAFLLARMGLEAPAQAEKKRHSVLASSADEERQRMNRSRSATPEDGASTPASIGEVSLVSELSESGQTSDLTTVFPDFFEAFDRSAVCFVAPKPVVNHRAAAGREEQGIIQTHASREELFFATSVLNFHRWLCGLAPVELNGNCTRMCQALNHALLPRTPVYLKPSAPQFSHLTEFATLLAEVIGVHERCIVLHGDASLLDGVEQCLLSSHAPKVETGPVSTSNEEAVARIQKRAENYMKFLPEELAMKATFNLIMPTSDSAVITLHTLPAALSKFHVLWHLIEKSTSGKKAPGQSSVRASRWQRMTKGASLEHLSSSLKPRKNDKPQIRTRTLEWCQEQSKNKESYRGDRDRKIFFRRRLLDPGLLSFGASRSNDTCAMWVAGGIVPTPQDTAPPSTDNYGNKFKEPIKSAEQRQREFRELEAAFPDVVCYPPRGWFPYEFLKGTVPTWTIMPNYQRYQPTQRLSVEMWRVHIEDGHAERLCEVGVSSLICDCSAKGNPFCIVFQPELQKISEGEQFEVELTGLRGFASESDADSTLYFFHEFRSFHAEHVDFHLLNAAEDLCTIVENPALWKQPGDRVIPMPPPAQAAEEERMKPFSKERGSSFGHGRRMTVFAPASVRTSTSKGQGPKIPEMFLVSHPSLTFTTDIHDMTISVCCPEAIMLQANLFLLRASADHGKVEIRRATWVLKCGTYFVIRVKLPLSQSRYELHLRPSSTADAPTDRTVRYNIVATEACPSMLVTLDHSLKEKFGFTYQSPLSQPRGVTVIAPVLHRVRSGFVYFLVHVDAEAYAEPDKQSQAQPYGTNLFSHRLAPSHTGDHAADKHNKSHMLHDKHNMSRHGSMSSNTSQFHLTKSVMDTFHEILKPGLEPVIQDIRHAVHIDISVLQKVEPEGGAAAVSQRYVKRLQRRPDLSEFYDRLLWFPDDDADCIIEMILRFPKSQTEQYTPLKIGEWRLTRRDEEFPAGF